jgi:hypothetical protein
MDLILDVKELIASCSADTFYRLWLYDDEFRKYAPKIARKYIRLFKEVCDGHPSLFGRYHSFDDKPVISHTGRQIWYYNGMIHRDGDLPAEIIYDARVWYHYGKRHRLTGHALECLDISGNQYYINDIRYQGKRKFERVRDRYMREKRVDLYNNPV